MKVTAIIQARMGSTRLPGKVMKHLTGKTVLQHVIDRVASARLLDEVIVATTISPQDDIIVTEAQKAGAKIFRGSEDDVLARYYHAAKTYKAEIIVRVTSDCPLFDPQILDEMLGIFLKENANGFNLDYMSNSLQPTFPRGLDAEIFTMRVLTKTFHEADKDYEREHVTPFIYLNPDQFRIKNFANRQDQSHHRWTLDTKEDFLLLKKIYEYSNAAVDQILTMKSILEIFANHPDLPAINAHIKQKKLGE